MHNVALWKIANHLFADSYIFETMSRPGPVAICWSEKHLNLCMELARALQSTGGPSGKCGRSIENAFQSAQQSRAQAHANWAVRLQLSRLHINIATLDTSGRKKGPACPVLINIWSERSRPTDGPRKNPKLPLEIFDRRIWNLTIFFPIFPLILCIEGPSKSSSWHCSYAACTQSGYKNFYNPPTYKQFSKEKRAPICSATINWFPTLMHRSCDFHFLSFVPSPLLGI